ncbi:Zn-ribbon domain-containing OB-fold protein [Mycolicibacter algericus]|jgi:uncharacterized OB-fold protein|uniref:ChsH2 C-terminal OB-fold domain-containing protein n=2 Tax=Mycolicibacter algericus TaxID=1288388 RepID=A0A7I9Y5T9_MYCAL|nr:OB-fold domain-containing protein [Mycolicibacter algericus]OQZ95045.1 3-ketoacyl-CoA thiolase [Mycolicibacter algericus DSM 45454]GFG83992.1 hypothetical protein MALGJ_06680 [Mycolicibacter algericus]
MTTVTDVADQDWLLESVLAPAIGGDAIRPLYDAAARGELALPFCGSCALALELEQLVCDGCGHTGRQWRAVEPRGTVHAATVMHRREPGLVRSADPYPIVDVELDSGHRIVMTLIAPGSAPDIGTRVRVGFRHLGDAELPAIEILEVPE